MTYLFLQCSKLNPQNVRHIRKRGKNKNAAKNSRKKKDAEIGKDNKLQFYDVRPDLEQARKVWS